MKVLASFVVATAVAIVLAPTPALASVQEGDPLVWYMSDKEGSQFCGPYGLVAAIENITGSGTCGSGFAVGAGGTSIAPPHVFEGFGLNRTADVGTSGRAHIVFSEILNPGVYEVQVTASAGGVVLLSGKQLCDISKPCDMELAGSGGSVRFEEALVQVEFPTIVGAFTPTIYYGGADPSRVELDGAWGIDYPGAAAAEAVIAPLANLTTDGVLHLGLGAGERCFALSFSELPESYCLVGEETFLGNHVLGEHWVAPRGFNATGGAVLRIGLAPYLVNAGPPPGSLALDVTLVAMGAPTLHGRADCKWDALPTTCEIRLTGRTVSVPWKGIMFLDITAIGDGRPVRLAAGPDPGTLTFNTWTWDPDPVPEAPGSIPAPGIGLPLLLGVLLILTARRR